MATTATYDIVFLLDNTGSMRQHISAVKNNIIPFANSLDEENINYRLGLVSFGDVNEEIGKVKNYGFINSETFQSNVETILNGINDNDGGDYPESGLEALVQGDQSALAMINSSGADHKRFVVVTDASFHNQGESGDGDSSAYLDSSDVLNSLNDAGVVLDVIGRKGLDSSDSCQSEWEPLANATGGEFYDINGNYSMIFEEIADEIFDDISDGDDSSDGGDYVIPTEEPIPTLPSGGGYVPPDDKPIINSEFEGRIMLAQWGYGFTPTEDSPLFGGTISNAD